jgi:hypothetical protein
MTGWINQFHNVSREQHESGCRSTSSMIEGASHAATAASSRREAMNRIVVTWITGYAIHWKVLAMSKTSISNQLLPDSFGSVMLVFRAVIGEGKILRHATSNAVASTDLTDFR